MVALTIIVCAVQWLGITYQVSFTMPIALMAATRCSVFIAYLAFPVLYRGLVVSILNRTAPSKYFRFLPHTVLIAAAVITFIDCKDIGKTSHDPFNADIIALSKWMQTTPPQTHFLVTERALQQDSFALRPAVFPLPYFITTAYRVRDERAVKFDRDMVEFWGPPKEQGRRWFDKYINGIERNNLQHMTEQQVLSLSKMYTTQYFVTRKTATPLSLPIIFKTAYFIVYEIPKHQ